MVLTYLHFRILEFPLTVGGCFSGATKIVEDIFEGTKQHGNKECSETCLFIFHQSSTFLVFWLVVWNMTFMTSHFIYGNVIIPTVTHTPSFFRGVGRKTTNQIFHDFPMIFPCFSDFFWFNPLFDPTNFPHRGGTPVTPTRLRACCGGLGIFENKQQRSG